MPRPKGSKNKSTILRESEVEKVLKNAQGLLLREVQGIIEVLVKRAKEGDISAAKLILERAIPAKRWTDEAPKTNFAIQVNITPTEIGHGEEQRKIGSEEEPRTAIEFDGNAAGDAGEGSEGFQIHAVDGSAKGQ